MSNRITKAQFDEFKRVNADKMEFFTEDQVNNWIVDVTESLTKAEVDEVDALTKAEVETFNEEFKEMTRIIVLSPPAESDLNKGVKEEVFYVRERMVEWQEELVKGEDGEPLLDEEEKEQKITKGFYADTELNRRLERVGKEVGLKEEENEG